MERFPGIFISESHGAPGPSLKHGERGFHRTLIDARHDGLLAAGVVGPRPVRIRSGRSSDTD
jgi:hypothetical protein